MQEVPEEVLYEVQSRMPERYGNEVFYKWRKIGIFSSLEEAKKQLDMVAEKYHMLIHRIITKQQDK